MKSKMIALLITIVMTGAFLMPSAKATNLKPAIQTATQKTNDWAAYKKEQEEKIKKNDERIAELRKARANAGQTIDEMYNKRIDKLQQQNTELRTKIVNYKYDDSKWESFKREFNHDMDELGKAIKDFGKDNVK